jgi:hypothetical protein
MKLQIERPRIEAMAAAFPHLAALKEQLRFGDKVEVNLAQLAASELDFLRDSYQKAGPEWHARAAHVATLQRAFTDSGPAFRSTSWNRCCRRSRAI